MNRCLLCDSIINWDYDNSYCRKHFAEWKLNQITGLCMDDLPDGLPIEDFVDENGELDFEGISSW